MTIWRSEAEVVVMEELRKEMMPRTRCVGDASRKLGPDGIRWKMDAGAALCEEEGREVCVTGGVSFVGSAIVQRLLRRGYAVRLLVESQEDMDKLSNMGAARYTGVRLMMVRIMDAESLCQAFDGCTGVFHTSSSLDSGGISGYSKQMVNMEVRAVEQVIEACVRTESVRKCVFTSSLAACIWRQSDPHGRQLQRPWVVDESCWSDESLCQDKKLWFALGKTMAEKAAWETARRSNLHLVTVCSALVTGPEFHRRNSTGSIAYLKRAHEMFAEGLLATVDLETVADAHVSVYEAAVASGRYICYDHIVRRSEEIKELERQLRVPISLAGKTNAGISLASGLSNRKLFRLMNSGRRCTCEAQSSDLS
ncbi:cinnamoyl-CoA reductase-like SNL6 [Zingiber officinale]|uniref:3-beta hydroxysteroid dehydrogenase/isomerase domain-containing protein n=1 Tax=Zingiber officinale TaxID=94328 RepID=A0A8J5LW37_ZINOF|nr:cinnamoyl-CoA reductase-like SNL6 [Zingiber officinale]KAG6533067.1 hypothetical protein ZIOFF_006928 [Zingiber officinale]